MERWLKSFAKISLGCTQAMGLLGIVTLVASLVFTLSGTGEPIIWIGITLGLFSVALGCLSVYLSDKSDKKIQVIADMEFDKIIGSMNPDENLPSAIERTVSNIRAALRISEWASPDSKSIFSVEFRKFIDLSKAQDINKDLVLALENIWQEHEMDKW